MWNPEREECLHTLSGHTNRVYSLQVRYRERRRITKIITSKIIKTNKLTNKLSNKLTNKLNKYATYAYTHGPVTGSALSPH